MSKQAFIEAFTTAREGVGIKHDSDKPRWDLLDPAFMEDVVKVLTRGSIKYADHNWRYVEPYRDRYYAAAMRHITAWRSGELLDPETGLPHVAHATCCLFFIWWKDQQKEANNDGN